MSILWQKALTVHQPWASLIISGFKPWEFRSWDYRQRARHLEGQRIGIHASRQPVDQNEIDYIIHAMRHCPDEVCLKTEALELLMAWRLAPGRLPLSAMLGTVVIGTPRLGSEIATEFGAAKVNDSTRDDEASFGWPMLDPVPLEPVIPMRGRQGFWNWRQA